MKTRGRKGRLSMMAGLLVVSTLLSGCYGQFALVKTLYKVNGTVENIYARSGVTALLLILPVYEFAGLGDAIIVNPIEFWSHVNPITNTPSVSSARTQGPGVDPTRTPDGWLTRKDASGKAVFLAWHYDKTAGRLDAIRIAREGLSPVTLYRSTLSAPGRIGSGPRVSSVTFPGGFPRFSSAGTGL